MITCYLLTSAGQTYSESYRWRSLILLWEESFRCVTHTDTSLEDEVLEELEKSRWAIANYGPALKQICWSLTFSNQSLSHGTSPILSVNTLPCRSVDHLPPPHPLIRFQIREILCLIEQDLMSVQWSQYLFVWSEDTDSRNKENWGITKMVILSIFSSE